MERKRGHLGSPCLYSREAWSETVGRCDSMRKLSLQQILPPRSCFLGQMTVLTATPHLENGHNISFSAHFSSCHFSSVMRCRMRSGNKTRNSFADSVPNTQQACIHHHSWFPNMYAALQITRMVFLGSPGLTSEGQVYLCA